MSYEHNWGFTDPTDEYGVKVLLNDYGSGLQSTDNNDFIIEIRYCHEVKRNYQTCSGESFLIFRIISDYEPISMLMVCRHVMECLECSFACPSPQRKEVVVFRMLSSQDGKKAADDIQSMIIKLKLMFGIEIVHLKDMSDRQSSSCHLNCDTFMECLVSAISHHVLAAKEWFAFSIDRQTNGVFAKKSFDGANFLDVITLKGWTNNSDGTVINSKYICSLSSLTLAPFTHHSLDGSTLLRFRTACCRVIDSDPNDFLHLNQDSVSMIFKPTGEEITIVAPNARRTILRSTEAIDTSHETIKGGAEKVHQQFCDESILLTGLDKRNRLQGYSLFLPDIKEKCDNYWRMGYGIELTCDTELQSATEKCAEYYLSEITMELGDLRIVPSQLLASSVGEIVSRTRRLAESTAHAFADQVRGFYFVEATTHPVRFQSIPTDTLVMIHPCTEISNISQISTPLHSRFQSALKMVMLENSCTSISPKVQKARFIAPKLSLLSKNCPLSPEKITKPEPSGQRFVESVKMKISGSKHSKSAQITAGNPSPVSKITLETRAELISRNYIAPKYNKRPSRTLSKKQEIEGGELVFRPVSGITVSRNEVIDVIPVKLISSTQKHDKKSLKNKRKKVALAEVDDSAKTVEATQHHHLSDDDSLSLETAVDDDDDLLFL